MSAARRRLGDTAAPASGLAAAYGRPLSMEEVFDKLLQLERQLGDERAERQRVEQALDEERAARQALERDMGARLRGMEIASKSGSGWKQELVGLREEMGGGADRAQKQLDDHKDSLNAILEVLEDTVTREQVEAALQGLRGEVAAGTGAAAGSATAEEVEELAAALEELDEKLSEQAQNLESVVDEIGETEEGLGARLGKCEEAAITASTLAASIPGEIEKGLQKFEAKTVRQNRRESALFYALPLSCVSVAGSLRSPSPAWFHRLSWISWWRVTSRRSSVVSRSPSGSRSLASIRSCSSSTRRSSTASVLSLPGYRRKTGCSTNRSVGFHSQWSGRWWKRSIN